MTEKISVLLVDDHALVRRGFRRMLEDEEDIVVKGEASPAFQAVAIGERHLLAIRTREAVEING